MRARGKILQKATIFAAAAVVILVVALGLAVEPWEQDVGILEKTTAGTFEMQARNTTQSASASTSPMYALTITSADASGNPKTGMYTTIREGSAIVLTGFTPLSFTGYLGATYSVSVSNYESSIFDHWEDGSTSSRRVVNFESDATITAYYRTESTSALTSGPALPENSSGHALIPKTGVLVSLYMYPGSAGSVHWQKVIDKKYEHPSVPIVAIFNPSSGPGSSKDNNIASWVGKLQNAGIIAIGYVPDGYADTKNPGARSMAYMMDAIKKYHDWYGADGIFFDEFSNRAGYEGRYNELTSYAKSFGMKITVGNPGASVPSSYIGTVDVINVTEGKGYMPISWLRDCSTCSEGNGWQYQYDKRNFSLLRYDISSLDKSFISEASQWVGLIYVTDGNDSNKRWFHVPPYFGELVATLDN